MGRTDAVIDKGRIGTHHFTYGNLAGTQTKSHRGMNLRITDAILMQQGYEGLRVQLTHQVGRYPVVRLL